MASVPDDRAETPPPTERAAGRVLLIDDGGALLLLRGCDPGALERGTWWFTPGGGLDEGETSADGARRELREETGFVAGDLGPVVFRRTTEFDFEGVRYRQREEFFCVRCSRFAIDEQGWTDVERRSVLGSRWWTPAELSATTEVLHPQQLAEIVTAILGVSS
jgi:8-oxo-dGTP pyrophosphatase MutT (NUDIX family)